jgi:hypothetical protein
MDLKVFYLAENLVVVDQDVPFKKGGLNISHAINSRLFILCYPVICYPDSSSPL